jgi:hypothetical protein
MFFSIGIIAFFFEFLILFLPVLSVLALFMVDFEFSSLEFKMFVFSLITDYIFYIKVTFTADWTHFLSSTFSLTLFDFSLDLNISAISAHFCSKCYID